MRRRVVITGRGAITPLGHSVQAMYQAQLAGKSGVARTERFNASRFPTTFAAEVRGFDLGKWIPRPERFPGCGLNTLFGLAAARQAIDEAGLATGANVNRDNFGVYLGAGEGTQDFHKLTWGIADSTDPETRKLNMARFCRGGLANYHPDSEAEQELHTTCGHVGREFDLRGPNYTCLTACAASSQAIGEATELIRHGDADIMLSGGTHSMIHPMGVTGFNLLTALSQRNSAPEKASRPFDLHRDGFVLGEGAAMLVLEELEHARARGAKIYAEITGYGSTSDAFRTTDCHPEGRGAIKCIQLALENSGLRPEDIGYINAHGTSTKVNDQVETLSIKKVFGDHAYKVPVSSSKSMLGHLIAAAGAVELLTCVEVLLHGVIPPTINYETPDPELDLDYVPNTAREMRVRHCLSNSFGFGGQNISLIVSRYDG